MTKRMAAWVAAGMIATGGWAQVPVPGDPFDGDPTGILADPCSIHDPAQSQGVAPDILFLHGYLRDFGGLCAYRADDQRLVAAGARPRVVFMGDSITWNWKDKDPAFFPDPVIVGRGIGGQTTAQMLLRFRDDVIALRPQAVQIMAGTNDVAGNTGPSTTATVLGNIASMAELARAHGIKVIIASIPPAAAFGWRPRIAAAARTIEGMNDWLKDYATRERFTYVDYHAVLATADGSMKPELSADGVHPNAAGYALMDPLARAAIAKAIGG